MSKYTTEVRYICEVAAGLTESPGLDSVETILENSWNKIFKDPAAGGPVIGSADYQKHICKLILQHYYTREISAETAGLWKLWLRTKMDEIAPYYDGIYKASAAVNLEKALLDVDYIRTHEGQSSHSTETAGTDAETRSGTDNETNTGRQQNTGTVTDAGTYSHDDRYSDTPQGAITELTAGRYLTNARLVSDSNGNTRTDNTQTDTTGSSNRTTSGTASRTTSGTEDGTAEDSYTDRTFGKMGGKSYTELMTDYRAAILPIDQMIIAEFKDLFMQIW